MCSLPGLGARCWMGLHRAARTSPQMFRVEVHGGVRCIGCGTRWCSTQRRRPQQPCFAGTTSATSLPFAVLRTYSWRASLDSKPLASRDRVAYFVDCGPHSKASVIHSYSRSFTTTSNPSPNLRGQHSAESQKNESAMQCVSLRFRRFKPARRQYLAARGL